MKFNQYQTLVEAEQSLRRKGFIEQFVLEGAHMRSSESGKLYAPKDMQILEYHRFEGASNPADMSIIFAVVCEDGKKGVIISSYGAKVNMKLIEFMDKVKILRRDKMRVQGVD